ncbi:MAG: host attachment protein [Gammaproteobacteria bacterium]|nr:host attachment protein [Gammaproteobacteria bacterium]
MTIWVVVADSSKARILAAENKTAELEDKSGFIHPASRMRAQDLVADGSGSGSDSGGYGRHSMGHESDPRQQEAEIFARELCGEIEEGCRDNNLHRVYLIAPPKFLGLLRGFLNKQCAERIEEEIDKNLVEHNIKDIRAHLPKLL